MSANILIARACCAHIRKPAEDLATTASDVHVRETTQDGIQDEGGPWDTTLVHLGENSRSVAMDCQAVYSKVSKTAISSATGLTKCAGAAIQIAVPCRPCRREKARIDELRSGSITCLESL